MQFDHQYRRRSTTLTLQQHQQLPLLLSSSSPLLINCSSPSLSTSHQPNCSGHGNGGGQGSCNGNENDSGGESGIGSGSKTGIPGGNSHKTKSSSSLFKPYQLSYREMTTDVNGAILSYETKFEIRKHMGLCLTCTDTPTQLFEIRRSRLNPLARATKILLTVPGESYDGNCYKCHPPNTITTSTRSSTSIPLLTSHGQTPTQQQSAQNRNLQNHQQFDPSYSSPNRMLQTNKPNNRNPFRTSTNGTTSAINSISTSRCMDTPAVHPYHKGLTSTSQFPPISTYCTIPSASNSTSSFASRKVPMSSSTHHSFLSSSVASSSSPASKKNQNLHQHQHQRHHNHTPTMHNSNSILQTQQDQSRPTSSCHYHPYQQQHYHRQQRENCMPSRSNNYTSTSALPGPSIRSNLSTCDLQSSLSDLSIDSFFSSNTNTTGGTTNNNDKHQHDQLNHGDGGGDTNTNGSLYSSMQPSATVVAGKIPSSSLSSPNYRISIKNDGANNKSNCINSEIAPTLNAISDSRCIVQGVKSTEHTADQEDADTVVARDLSLFLKDLLADGNTTNPGNCSGCTDIVLEVIINSMESHRNNVKVQMMCLQTIVELFGRCDTASGFADDEFDDDEISQCQRLAIPFIDGSSMPFIKEARGHIHIMQIMQIHEKSLPIQEMACKALSVLAIIDTPTRLILISNGTCEQLLALVASMSILHSDATNTKEPSRIPTDKPNQHGFSNSVSSCHAVVGQALKLLRMLSVEAEARKILQNHNFCNTLVIVMEQHRLYEPIQWDGCALISNIIIDVDKKQVAAVSKDVVKVVAEAILVHRTTHPEVVASAYFAFKNMSYNDTNLRLMSRMKVLDYSNSSGNNSSIPDRRHGCPKMIATALSSSRPPCVVAVDMTDILRHTIGIDNSSIMNADYLIEELYMIRAQDNSLEEEILRSIKELVSNHLNAFSIQQEENQQQQKQAQQQLPHSQHKAKYGDDNHEGKNNLCDDSDCSPGDRSSSSIIMKQLLNLIDEYPWSNRIVATCLQKINALAATSDCHARALKMHADETTLKNLSKQFLEGELGNIDVVVGSICTNNDSNQNDTHTLHHSDIDDNALVLEMEKEFAIMFSLLASL